MSSNIKTSTNNHPKLAEASHNKKVRTKFQQSCVDILAGTIAGINVTLVGHPFDTLKIRLQTQPSINPIYLGVVDCFKKTIQWEGFQGLYKGVSSPLIGQMFFRANLFLAYGQAKHLILHLRNKDTLSDIDYFIAGGIAWSVGALAECPIDFFKTQMQIQIIRSKTIKDFQPEYANLKECFTKVIKMNGFAGAYQGFVPHIIRNFPAGAAHFGMFEKTRKYFAEKENIPVKDIGVTKTIIAGGVGGWCYWFFFYPLDIVKSAIQSDSPDKSKKKFNGVIDTYRKLYEDGGIKRFYRGFSPCLMRAIPANAVLLFSSSYLSEHL